MQSPYFGVDYLSVLNSLGLAYYCTSKCKKYSWIVGLLCQHSYWRHYLHQSRCTIKPCLRLYLVGWKIYQTFMEPRSTKRRYTSNRLQDQFWQRTWNKRLLSYRYKHCYQLLSRKRGAGNFLHFQGIGSKCIWPEWLLKQYYCSCRSDAR